MGFRDWFRKPPPSRIESRIEFIGEQDGENERRFKAQLLPLLEKESHIQRAYLARVGLQSADAPSVALCLVSTSGEDIALVKRIDELFRSFAPGNVFLDVGFLTPRQEDALARVCPPFYQTPLPQS